MVITNQFELTDYLLKHANMGRLGHAGYTLLVLSSYVGEGWKCWPSMETLSGRTGASQKTIQRHIDYLVDIGWVTREKSGEAGKYSHNIYTIHVDRIQGGS